MKKWFFLLAFLLMFSFVSAVGTFNLSNSTFGLNEEGIGVKEKSNEILSKDVEVPENMQLLSRLVFGLKADERLSLQTFVLYICFFILFVLLVHSAVEIISSAWKAWAISLIVALLGSSSGVMKEIVAWYAGFGKLFELLGEWGIISLALNIIFMLVIFGILLKLLGKLKAMKGVEEFRQMGQNIGFFAALSRSYRKSIEESRKNI